MSEDPQIGKSLATTAILIVLATGAILVTIAQALIYAFVLKDLWRWFIVPMGAMEIGWLQAYGVMLVAAIFKFNLARQPRPTEETAGQRFGRYAASWVLGPAITWIVGYIVAGQI